MHQINKPKSSSHGGSRTGSGRKKGSSAYGESTKAIRVPESMLPVIKDLLAQRKLQASSESGSASASSSLPTLNLESLSTPAEDPNSINVPLFIGKVSAGFPSPAEDYIEKTLDLNDLLIQKPAATFFVRAEGESMLGAGIHPNDILVVDRSIKAVVGKIVICALNGELTVKRLKHIGDEIILGAENPDYSDIVVREEIEFVIWGVVTNVIHSV